MNSILAIRSKMNINSGHQGFAAAHVQGLWQTG